VSLTTVRAETVEAFLAQLAARVPAPGGGATAALHAAQSATLVAMVARYSNGARYDADLMARIFTEADGLRDEACRWPRRTRPRDPSRACCGRPRSALPSGRR
jgi:hypothetical protein